MHAGDGAASRAALSAWWRARTPNERAVTVALWVAVLLWTLFGDGYWPLDLLTGAAGALAVMIGSRSLHDPDEEL